jgi:hypothetical protein
MLTCYQQLANFARMRGQRLGKKRAGLSLKYNQWVRPRVLDGLELLVPEQFT